MNSPFVKKLTFLHTGHIGDIIAFLPIYYGMGGSHLVIKDGDSWMAPMKGFKYNSLKPLLENQGISVSFNDFNVVDYDMTHWRECYEHHISLMDSQARYVNFVPKKTGHVKITEPWLKVDQDSNTLGKIVFNRSPRYHNPAFNWKRIHGAYHKNAVFIGTEYEYADFCRDVGEVEYYPTADCLAVARAISACSLFVGNQSSACWIAMGLMKPLIQEVYPPSPNSIIKYNGAIYGFDDKIKLLNL
jgi:hypothetical protein